MRRSPCQSCRRLPVRDSFFKTLILYGSISRRGGWSVFFGLVGILTKLLTTAGSTPKLEIRLAPFPADPTERPQVETFAVEPGKVVIKHIKEGLNRIMFNYVEQGSEAGKRLFWDNQFRVLSNQRVNCFFYKAWDAKATGPVRYRCAHEPMPKLPRPAKPSQ